MNGAFKTEKIAVLLVAVLFFSIFLYSVNAAVPSGANIVGSPVVDSGPTRSPASRTDPGGKIITVNLNAEQQTGAWKAYIGNVTGTFVLQNSNNKSIYEWPALATATGELYISRAANINFSSVACAGNNNITLEQQALSMSASDTTNINRTFNTTAHKTFVVGTTTISNNTCPSIATWVNDTVQSAGESAVFQEVLLSDGPNLIYASLLNDNQYGFDNMTYDFQAIVAENTTSATGNTYYFFLELG